MRWSGLIFIPFMLAVMGLAACDSEFVPAGAGDPPGGSEPAPRSGQPVGKEPWGEVVDPTVPARDFTLTDGSGNPFRLSERQGEVAALFFGYTNCPDVCPLTLSHMAQALAILEEEGERVDFLFITVDPERDTPERIGEYTGRFHPDIVGLTGSATSLRPLWEAYGIMAEKRPLESGGYAVDHTAHVWLVDAEGKLRVRLPLAAGPQALANDIRWLLAESAAGTGSEPGS